MELVGSPQLRAVPDIRHKVRHLIWFRSALRQYAASAGQKLGYHFTVNDRIVTQTLLNWRRVFDARKSVAQDQRIDFVFYSAGLMLSELIRNNPVAAAPLAGYQGTKGNLPTSQLADIAAYWPEGLFYLDFCTSVANAVLSQDFGEEVQLSAEALDLRNWWSFRENVAEDPALAIAFFDFFTGRQPNWQLPSLPNISTTASGKARLSG